MRAVVMHEFGPPSVLVPEEVPDPAPGPHQVVVDVEAANITFVETQVRAGRPPNPSMLPALPAILGNGVGGAVARVGEQVDPELIGRRVVASLGGTGGYAQSAVAEAAALIDVPDALSTSEAVALLADGRTALMLMRAADVLAGETRRYSSKLPPAAWAACWYSSPPEPGLVLSAPPVVNASCGFRESWAP